MAASAHAAANFNIPKSEDAMRSTQEKGSPSLQHKPLNRWLCSTPSAKLSTLNATAHDASSVRCTTNESRPDRFSRFTYSSLRLHTVDCRCAMRAMWLSGSK